MKLLSMLIVTPPHVSLWPPRYCFIRPPGRQPSSGMYVVEVSALPSHRAIQIRSGSENWPGRCVRASSSILMPELALE